MSLCVDVDGPKAHESNQPAQLDSDTRLDGEGVLRYDMTAHEQRPPPPPSSGGGCTDATRGWERSPDSVPSIYRLAGQVAQCTEPSGRGGNSPMDRSIME
jgi:hypothetical protein